nr:spindle and kinetochore-associated protein 2-like [Ipomoea batatas]GMD23325.1 spindle and kinetochore-associated protein 2-like [Ipomoea batatas]GMD24707.1 spindle and kinetochore-associated protein 2-like [Ipomoea batatas]
MKLVSRINKIQEELASIQEQCRELLAAKQDLIDKARSTLVGNRSLLQKLQASAGVPVIDDSNDPEFANFNQVIDEWTAQVRAGADDEDQEAVSEDINHLLFSAIVPGN